MNVRAAAFSLLLVVSATAQAGDRPRARESGITIGILAPGPLNAITDVAGVRVGHVTLVEGTSIRTGVTAIVPHAGNLYQDKVPAGFAVGNAYGKFMGSTQVEELGEIETPILLTNTLNVPEAAAGAIGWTLRQPGNAEVRSVNAVVGETNDGFLNDIRARRVTPSDAIAAIEAAKGGPVAEGTVGAGTGMVSYGFKGGIGTASRRLPEKEGGYMVGVLVNANHGRRPELVVAGVPVGKRYDEGAPKGDAVRPGLSEGSIIILVATNAPLDGRQLTRLATRAALGLARTGSSARHGSGDFILAFSTGNVIPHYPQDPTYNLTHLADTHLNPLITATAEASEEAVLNALTMATTVVGRDGHRAEAIDLGRLKALMSEPRP